MALERVRQQVTRAQEPWQQKGEELGTGMTTGRSGTAAGLQHGSSPEGAAASLLSPYCAPAALTLALGCREPGASAQAPPCPSDERTDARSQPAVPGEAVQPLSFTLSPSMCPLRTCKTTVPALAGAVRCLSWKPISLPSLWSTFYLKES